MNEHRETIVDQFTRQADVFADAAPITDERALDLLVNAAATTGDDTVLDVACGPGIVVCAFAERAGHATGIDLTPAMIERAKALQEKKGLTNVTWRMGDVKTMPFPDGAFSVVCCRFALHHFVDPKRVLAEMARVCQPGGRVVLADVAAPENREKAERLNAMDSLRDPSHVRFMPESEMQGLCGTLGLSALSSEHYRLEGDMDSLLGRSFPNEGDAKIIRGMFDESVEDDGMGMATRRDGELIRYGYPVVILVATVPG